MNTARTIEIFGKALVHNSEQGKDYEEPVIVTLQLSEYNQEWHVVSVHHAETLEDLWRTA